MLDRIDHLRRELVRLGDKALHCGFAAAKHQRSRRQADELESAHTLVNLRACGSQHGGIDSVDVGLAKRLGLLEIAAQRFVSRFERATQLVVHPGQGAQIVDRVALVTCAARVHARLCMKTVTRS